MVHSGLFSYPMPQADTTSTFHFSSVNCTLGTGCAHISCDYLSHKQRDFLIKGLKIVRRDVQETCSDPNSSGTENKSHECLKWSCLALRCITGIEDVFIYLFMLKNQSFDFPLLLSFYGSFYGRTSTIALFWCYHLRALELRIFKFYAVDLKGIQRWLIMKSGGVELESIEPTGLLRPAPHLYTRLVVRGYISRY